MAANNNNNKEISRILESYFQASGSIQRRSTLYQNNWSSGCDAYVKHDYDGAINEFKSGEHSKMLYNLGMAHLQLNNVDAARDAFSKALQKDRFFALGWFQKAYCDYIAKDYATAFQNYIMAKKLLHENVCIDYSKIGCKYELKKAEILYNLAIVHLQLGNLDEVNRAVNEGKLVGDKSTSAIDFEGLRSKKAGAPIYSQTEIFYPPILANAAKSRANTNTEKVVPAVKDELAEAIRQKIKILDERDQAQIYQVLSTIKRMCGEETVAHKEIPDIVGREDFLVRQLMELRDVVYNRDVTKVLNRHAREMLKSSDKRTEKWKLWCDLQIEHSTSGLEDEYLSLFIKSDVARAALLSVCAHPATEDEELYLLQIFSFLLLPTLKPESVVEFISALSRCTERNQPLANLVVDSVLSLENVPTQNPDETTSIFPSYFESIELHEQALKCTKVKNCVTIIHSIDQTVKNQVQDLATDKSRAEREFDSKNETSRGQLTQMDAEIEELKAKLTQHASDIQATTTALNTKKVQQKTKVDKLELVKQDRVDYVKQREVEELKLKDKFQLTQMKIATFSKSVRSLQALDKHLQGAVNKLVDKFIPTMLHLVSAQENNLQFLATKFNNYQSSMSEFESEPDIYAKLRSAFMHCARNYRILAHNTSILAQSAQILGQVLAVRELDDACRAHVRSAQERIVELGVRAYDMEAQFSISKGGNQ